MTVGHEPILIDKSLLVMWPLDVCIYADNIRLLGCPITIYVVSALSFCQ